MKDLIYRELQSAGHSVANECGIYVNLAAVVAVNFKGYSAHVIARGDDDTPLCNEVLAEFLRRKLVQYQYTQDLRTRLKNSTPLVDVRLPEYTQPEDLLIWANAIAAGVSSYLTKSSQV